MKVMNAIMLAGMLAASACASATTKVLDPAAGGAKSASLAIEHGEDTVAVDDEYSAYFREKLAENLYGDGGFTDGGGITLTYRFMQIDNGSRAARYMLGPIAGKGSLAIEIVYADDAGVELARVETGGEISGGFFGGSFKSALKKAARETADYAQANFLP